MAKTTYPEESIYNHLPDVVPPKTMLRFRPKFGPIVSMDGTFYKKTMKTMGPPKVEAPSPDNYLKKHSKETKLPEKKEHCHRTCTIKKPPVPLRSEHPQMQFDKEKNQVKTTSIMPIKSREPISVDSHRGYRAHLEQSGLVPKYVKKKSYGKVPMYLQHRSQEAERSIEAYNMYVKEKMNQGAMRQLSEDERETNLECLKTALAEVNKKYQRLPLVADTLMRKTRKEQLEKDLKQLENDVCLFEKFKTIYIVN
ncbi:enkurin [Stigmatopora nigra]